MMTNNPIIGLEVVARHWDVEPLTDNKGRRVVPGQSVHAADYAYLQYIYLLRQIAEIGKDYGVHAYTNGLPTNVEVYSSPSPRALDPVIDGQTRMKAIFNMDLYKNRELPPMRSRVEIKAAETQALRRARLSWANGRFVSMHDVEQIIAVAESSLDDITSLMAVKELEARKVGIMVDPTLSDPLGSTVLHQGTGQELYELITDKSMFGESGWISIISNTMQTHASLKNRYSHKKLAEGLPVRINITHGGVVVGKNAVTALWNDMELTKLADILYCDLKEQYGPSYGNGSARLIAHHLDGSLELRERIDAPTGVTKPSRKIELPGKDKLYSFAEDIYQLS